MLTSPGLPRRVFLLMVQDRCYSESDVEVGHAVIGKGGEARLC